METLPLSGEGELIKHALGQQWEYLHPDIQKRFSKTPPLGTVLYYKGTITKLWCSRVGQWLAYLTYPWVGGALIPYRDEHFPIDIAVFSKIADSAIYKRRWYQLNKHPPIIFTSSMYAGSNNTLLEYVGCGLGMILKVSAVDQELHFHSQGYFWQIGRKKISLPPFLTPGHTWLIHRNQSPEAFKVQITITHPWWGVTFMQEGEFYETYEPVTQRLE